MENLDQIIIQDDGSFVFNNTEGNLIELYTPMLIANSYQKLLDAQANNETNGTSSQHLFDMGYELGMSTKLFAKRGNQVIQEEESYRKEEFLILVILLTLVMLVIIVYYCSVHKKKGQK